MVVAFTTGFLFVYGLAADVLFRHRTFLPSRFEVLAHYHLMALFAVSFTRHAIAKPLFYIPFVLVAVTLEMAILRQVWRISLQHTLSAGSHLGAGTFRRGPIEKWR
jgi:hypothetical protein